MLISDLLGEGDSSVQINVHAFYQIMTLMKYVNDLLTFSFQDTNGSISTKMNQHCLSDIL